MLSPPVFRGLLPFPSLPSAAHGRVLAVAYPAPVQRGQTHRARCIRINEAHWAAHCNLRPRALFGGPAKGCLRHLLSLCGRIDI